MIRLIYLLFIASGFVGLVYESLWARYLRLFLGHSAYGQLLTICIYMGGLGIGSFVGGVLAKRSRNPLLLYAGIELLAGLGGLAYHAVYIMSTDAFFNVALPQGIAPWAIVAVKVVIATLMTGPVAVLLGMTFPCLAVALMRLTGDEGSRSLPGLYFTNSLGAAAGILAASYLLVPLLGSAGSLRAAGIANLLIAGAFVLIARASPHGRDAVDGERSTDADAPPFPPPRSAWWLYFWLGLSAATGFSSFVYEIGWIRLLSMVLGSATHSFDIMVSAFILGLAFGGIFSRRLLRTVGSIPSALGIVQIAMGVCALATIYAYKPFFMLMNRSHLWFARDDVGFAEVTVFKYLLCLLLMFPASFCAGMTLPMITRYLTSRTRNEIHAGTVYGANTIGAICGAIAGGLILLPCAQLEATIAAGAGIDLLLGLVLVGGLRLRGWRPALAWVVCIAAVVPVFFLHYNKEVLVSGVFRRRVAFTGFDTTVIRDGATATISFQMHDSLRCLKTNGKPDASLNPFVNGDREDDEYTQAGVAFIPMAYLDRPYTAALIGFGSGMTTHHLLADPLVRSVDIVEIEKEVRRIAVGFLPYNERAFTDPRVHFVVDDAKTFFHVNRKTYDLIISQPSNPWVSGVASLFTREFYVHINRFLNDNGVLVQWMHLYEFDSDLLLSIVKAMEEVFPSFQMFRIAHESDIVLVACKGTARAMDWHRLATTAEIRADFDRLEIPPDFYGMHNYMVSSRTLAPLLRECRANSDFFPVVDNNAERAFYLDRRVDLFDGLTENCVYYQELLEPETFGPALRAIREKAGEKAADTAGMRVLAGMLRNATLETDWEAIDSVFYSTVYDFAGTARWDTIAAVVTYRELVRQDIPPLFMQQRFSVVDFAVRGMHAEAVRVVREMADTFPIDEATATLLRTMIIEAARSGDADLCRRLHGRLVAKNNRFDKYERVLIEDLLTRRVHH